MNDEKQKNVVPKLKAWIEHNRSTYNETKALESYYWSHYRSEITQDNLGPTHEWLLTNTPKHLQERMEAHFEKIKTAAKTHKQALKENPNMANMDISWRWPKAEPDLLEVLGKLHEKYDRMLLNTFLESHNTEIKVPRCILCNKVIKYPKTDKCIYCGWNFKELEDNN